MKGNVGFEGGLFSKSDIISEGIVLWKRNVFLRRGRAIGERRIFEEEPIFGRKRVFREEHIFLRERIFELKGTVFHEERIFGVVERISRSKGLHLHKSILLFFSVQLYVDTRSL